jgi:hypothetical protein
MCELNARITEWRDGLASKLSAAELDELEDHLREALAGLPEGALSPDERFLIATHRLGEPEAVVGEFAKSDPARVWRERALWMLAGWAGVGLVGGLTVGVAEGLALGVRSLGASHPVAATAGYGVHVVVWLLVATQLVALLRGNDRRARDLIAWVSGWPGSLRIVLAVAVALVLLGLPRIFVDLMYFRFMTPREFGSARLASHYVGLVVTTGLIIAALTLAARERRGVATGRS